MGKQRYEVLIPSLDVAERLLWPLRRGRQTVLMVRDPWAQSPRQRALGTPAEPAPVPLLLVPLRLGSRRQRWQGQLLVSVVGKGSAVMATTAVTPSALHQAGLSMQAAKLLAKSLNELFNSLQLEKKHD